VSAGPGLPEFLAERVRRDRGLTGPRTSTFLLKAGQKGMFDGGASLRREFTTAWWNLAGVGLALRPGQKFRVFQIGALLGLGGMGVVYKVWHLTRKKTFALKLLRPRYAADGEFRGRFWNEIQAAVRLRNAYTARVFEVSEDRFPYYTMEYVPGPTLADLLDQQPGRGLSLGPALVLTWMIADSLREAHAAGIVHRDVKPANILIHPATRKGVLFKELPPLSLGGKARTEYRAVLTDFGIARARAAGRELTATGEVLGTPLYMSPEQMEGDSSRIGPPSDVYSLGMVLYECLTGETMAGTPPAGLELPAEVKGVLDRALARHAKDRYQDGRELRDAIAVAMKSALGQRGAPPP
jgi:serine/threonine-protein kinase